MDNLNEIITKIEQLLDEKEQIRDIAIKNSRVITKYARAIIHGLRTTTLDNKILINIKTEVMNLKSLLVEHPDLYTAPYIESALQEYAESMFFLSILNREKKIPTSSELGITHTPYILGLADTIGELRRVALESLNKNNYEDADYYSKTMEKIYTEIMRLDYPNSILSIRQKQDWARSLIERTRSDLLYAKSRVQSSGFRDQSQ